MLTNSNAGQISFKKLADFVQTASYIIQEFTGDCTYFVKCTQSSEIALQLDHIL